MNPVLNLNERFTCDRDALWSAIVDRRDEWWGDGETQARKIDPPKLSLRANDTLVILVVQGSREAELSILHSQFDSSQARDAESALWTERLQRLRNLLE